MEKTYKYRLYPTKKQVEKLEWTLDICRILYNCALQDRGNCYKETGEGLNLTKQEAVLKNNKQEYPLLNEIHSQVLQDVLIRVDKAFTNFFRRVRVGEKAGYPRFKGESRYDSITYPQQPGFSIIPEGLKLSKIGTIKVKFHRPVNGTIKTCSIKRDVDRWYACFSVEYEPIRPENRLAKAIGIDMGLKSFATLSNGEIIKNPEYLRRSEKRLIKKQKVLSRREKGSHNRDKARLIVAKIHRQIRDQRADFCHKVSHKIVSSFGFIAVEDLSIKNMVKNHHLAKSINDASWGQFLTFLQYKAEEAGVGFGRVVPKDTSIICSVCGERVPKTLATRIHKCPYCKTILDRDYNAAINILHKSTAGIAGSYAWGECSHQDTSLNQEALSFREG